MTVPFGGGFAFGYGGFVADARFTYRKTYYNNLVSGGGNLDSWGGRRANRAWVLATRG